jgi:type II secretory pathway component PulM
MPKSFNFVRATAPLRGMKISALKDPRVSMRVALGALLLANVIAALILFKPWGGSADDLERRLNSMQQQLPKQQAQLAHTKLLVEKVEKARRESDQFMAKYLLNGRSTFSSVLGELNQDAAKVNLKPKDSQLTIEPIEGSDTLGMISITANYEGEYPNLTKFINELDRSPRFLIIERIQAAPQPVGNVVNANFRLLAFVKDDTGGLQ